MMKKGTKIQVFLLCLVPFIMVLGNSMLIPVLPKIKKAVGINQFQVGLGNGFFDTRSIGYLLPEFFRPSRS